MKKLSPKKMARAIMHGDCEPTTETVNQALGRKHRKAKDAGMAPYVGGVIFRSKFPGLFDGGAWFLEAVIVPTPFDKRVNGLYIGAWTSGKTAGCGLMLRVTDGYLTETGEFLSWGDEHSDFMTFGAVVRATSHAGNHVRTMGRGYWSDEGLTVAIEDGRATWFPEETRRQGARTVAIEERAA